MFSGSVINHHKEAYLPCPEMVVHNPCTQFGRLAIIIIIVLFILFHRGYVPLIALPTEYRPPASCSTTTVQVLEKCSPTSSSSLTHHHRNTHTHRAQHSTQYPAGTLARLLAGIPTPLLVCARFVLLLQSAPNQSKHFRSTTLSANFGALISGRKFPESY